MPELNPSLLKEESRKNAPFQTELHRVKKGLLHLQQAWEGKKQLRQVELSAHRETPRHH